MKNKLTINLDKMKKGYNGVTDRDYLWTIVDEDKNNMYEIQIIKFNFPSTLKDIRNGDNPGADALQETKELLYSGKRITELMNGKTIN